MRLSIKINLFKTLLLLGVSFLFSEVTAQNIDCNKFKTGKFYYPYVESDANVKVIRKKKKQIEKSTLKNGKKNKSVHKVEWISPCIYKLTLKKTKLKSAKKYIGREIIVEIIETKKSEYFFIAKLNDGRKLNNSGKCLRLYKRSCLK